MNSFRFLERGIEAELRAPARAARRGRAGRAGDAPLPPRGRLADAAALEGVRARLPLLPRARPGPGGPDRGDAEGGPRSASRAAGGAARALHERGRHLRGGRERPSPSSPPTASTSSGRWRRRRRRLGQGDRQLGHRRARGRAARGRRGGGPDVVEGDAGGGGGPRRPGGGKVDLTRLRQAGARRSWSPRAATRRRSSRARASARSRTPAELEKIVDAAIEAEPEAARAGSRRQRQGRSAGSWARVMKETKGRADGGAVQRLIRERLGAK